MKAVRFWQCFLLAMLLWPVGAGAGSSEAYEVFKTGLDLEKSLSIFKARDEFKGAIALDPENPGYLQHYGWFLHYNGFREEAIEVFARLLTVSEDAEYLYRGIGWNQKMVGRLAASYEAYSQVFDLRSSSEQLGAAMEEVSGILHKENQKKIDALRLDLGKKPSDLKAKKELFRTYISQGELENAVLTGQEIVSEDPADKLLQLQLARALFWNGEKVQAETEYRKLIADFPDSAFLYFEIGDVLDAQGKEAQAITALEKSLDLYPDSAMTRKKLAEVLAKTGSGHEAVELAASITPAGYQQLTGLLARARAFHFSGRLEEARSAYRTVLDEYPYNTDALWGLTETSVYTGNYKGARETLEKWDGAIPDDRVRVQKDLLDYYQSPLAGLKVEHYENSSDFARTNAGGNCSFYARSDLRLDLGYQLSHFDQDGFEDIFRHGPFAEVEKSFSDVLRVAGRLAGNFYDHGHDNLNGGASLYLHPTRNGRRH